MRSKPAFNYPAFMDGASRLRAAGWFVYNPAEMDIAEDGPKGIAAPTTLSIKEQQEHAARYDNARRYAKRDVAVLIEKLRAEIGDAIVVLPDWQESTGAKAEVAVALWVGLPMLTLEEALSK